MRFKTRIIALLCCLMIFALCFIFIPSGEIPVPHIYAITPTYDHITQKAELVSLVILLQRIERLVWIVVEDKEKKSQWLADFLDESGLNFVHLNAPTPDTFRNEKVNGKLYMPKGVEQRNAGLTWLRTHNVYDGVVYFMDDDNTYHPRVFDEMRHTKRVSIWPVGFAGGALVESPVVGRNGKVVGFIGGFAKHRMFPVDMAGFAVNVEHILNSDAVFSRLETMGILETRFLEDLGFILDDLEPKADNCMTVLAWHTKLSQPKLKYDVDWKGGEV